MCQSVPQGFDAPALNPHEYPIWIKAFAGFVVVVLIYSLAMVPSSLVAARELKQAQKLFEEGKAKEAVEKYEVVRKKVPGSSDARLGEAEALFTLNNRNADEKALDLLVGLTLDKYDIKRLEKVMPKQYWALFTITGGKNKSKSGKGKIKTVKYEASDAGSEDTPASE